MSWLGAVSHRAHMPLQDESQSLLMQAGEAQRRKRTYSRMGVGPGVVVVATGRLDVDDGGPDRERDADAKIGHRYGSESDKASGRESRVCACDDSTKVAAVADQAVHGVGCGRARQRKLDCADVEKALVPE